MTFERFVVILIFIALFIGSGFVQAVMGFGYAVVALTFLPHFLDIRLANLVVSVSLLVPLLCTGKRYFVDLRYSTLSLCLSGAFLGLPIGMAVFSIVNADWLVRGTGMAILLMVVEELLGHFRRNNVRFTSSWDWLWSLAAGLLSGFLSGSVGIGGPPIVAYAARQEWTVNAHKAFIITFSLITLTVRLIGLCLAGFITGKVVLLSAAALLCAMFGIKLGGYFSEIIDAKLFRNLTFGLLTLSAMGMIFQGFSLGKMH